MRATPELAKKLRERGDPEDVELLTREQMEIERSEDGPYFEIWAGGEPFYYRLLAQEQARRAEWEASPEAAAYKKEMEKAAE